MVTADKSIDCKGLSCPEPILHTKMAINEMTSGQILEMVATDPGSVSDMDAWARRTGNEIVDKSEESGTFRYLIKKT